MLQDLHVQPEQLHNEYKSGTPFREFEIQATSLAAGMGTDVATCLNLSTSPEA